MSRDASLRAYRLSGLARPLDPSYPTNRAVLAVMPPLFLAGTVFVALAGATWPEAALSSARLVLVAFVAWALARELAPDQEYAAFAALALAVVGWVAWPAQAVLLPLVVLVVARIVNRSTGKAAERIDTLVVVPAFVASGWLVSWTSPLAGALALLLDGTLPVAEGQVRRRAHVAASIAVLAGSTPAWIRGLAGSAPASWPWEGALAVVASGIALGTQPVLASVGDVDRAPLLPVRIRLGAVAGLLAVTMAGLDAQWPPHRVATAWAAVLATSLWIFAVRVSRWTRRQFGRGPGGGP